jgi:hypothetical protein
MSGSFGFDLPHAHFPGTVEAQMSCAAKKYQPAKMHFGKPKLYYTFQATQSAYKVLSTQPPQF